MRTVVIGSGSWGTALAQVLQDNHQEVLVYGLQKLKLMILMKIIKTQSILEMLN